MAGDVDAYAPIGVPKPIGRDIWIVDGPVVRMRYGLGSLPFPTRMTVVRLPDGRLWLHSPVKITSGLVPRIEALGPVAALVAPNRLHWMALGEWQEVFPEAVTWAAPGLRPRRGFRIDHVLDDDSPSWGGAIAQLLVPGRFMTEAVFLHRDSRTLILTDLIENFERGRVHGWLLRLLTRIGGVLDPEGSTPRDLRVTFQRRTVRGAVQTMLGWAPERVVMAHGRPYLQDGTAELRRALAWAI
jgi:Domain of unknown function (DUF4336)